MANSLYDKGRDSFLNAQINWGSDNIKIVFVDTTLYTANLSSDQFLSDIPSGARVATSPNLSGKSSSAGVANASSTVTSSVSGAVIEAFALYQDTGTAGTSRLIGLIDTATGLPLTPNGGDITVSWDTGANKIFKL